MEAAMLPIERTSSIEWEPRTLNIDQVRSARDLAIYILKTKTFEEASRIFTEGLKPVVSSGCSCSCSSSMGSGDMDLDEEWKMAKLKYVAQEEPAAEAFRDIATAPF